MAIDYNNLETQLIAECETLIEVIRGVVANWESGNLAAQVNLAREAADMAEDFIVNNCGEDQRNATNTMKKLEAEARANNPHAYNEDREAEIARRCEADEPDR